MSTSHNVTRTRTSLNPDNCQRPTFANTTVVVQCLHGGCSPVISPPSCVCHDGWTGGGVGGGDCSTDVDECGGAPCGAACTNTLGSFQCSCTTGLVAPPSSRALAERGAEALQSSSNRPVHFLCFFLERCFPCLVSHDCGAILFRRCCWLAGEVALGVRCVEAFSPLTLRRPRCSFELAPNLRDCVDVNECATAAAPLCTATDGTGAAACVNTPGAYRCQCSAGCVSLSLGCELVCGWVEERKKTCGSGCKSACARRAVIVC